MTRICWECPQLHYENCDGCLGFGVYGRHQPPAPLIAAIGHGDEPLPHDSRPCGVCGTETRHLADAYFAGALWSVNNPQFSSLLFDRRSNFLRWVGVLHAAWESQTYPLFAQHLEAMS